MRLPFPFSLPTAAAATSATTSLAAVLAFTRVGGGYVQRYGVAIGMRIGIGCRDGRSISVAIATHLAATLSTRGLQATARHRELARQRRRERAAEQQPAPSAQPPPAAAAGEAEAEGETGDVPADAAQAGVKALFANNQAA